ncbi:MULTISPECIES: xanthine dehydrogenase family protein molybdopterin-binding subunit [unclassified Cellulophaga]|uniref:xanthine dehydrogenase family protein molybdopterin-binding subunit n=1 Tax=unclassified Cellulophaga TaxID=2634405 RepID=UPI0026E342AD|nr:MULTISPECIES: molybdopterin cofactor-binding domain-containing protein [unclassified Cellulophaga]MDO6490208.1 molybdopterin-dependent oxidoreductase [Cellulophaga sp. 2_MG-2023]MDO6494598.1 molybdopterin-dependent oxidoreductase [Cellulophaga sp. 3_MG-2023]
MKDVKNVSRRSFLKGLGLASGGLIIASGTTLFTGCEPKEIIEFNPNLFVQLNSDGNLILVASRSEMGQGVRTSLTSVIADEMEADWDRVSIKQAVGDAKYGDQNTDGSKSVRLLYEEMRKIGAATKAVLIAAAAKKWEVPASELKAENHFVISNSGKKIGFGELVEVAKTIEVPKDVVLKDPKDFKYIGKYLPSKDVENLSNGSAVFGLDKRLDNMKFAAIKRCPVTFGTVKSFDKTEALKITGVIDVVEIPRVEKPFGPLGGVAVVATNTWAAFKGKEALKVEWDLGDNKGYNSDAYMEELTANVHKKGKVAKSVGNVDDAFKKASKTIESTYQLPHLVHTPMEVPNAVAWVQGDNCEIWAPTQEPQRTRTEVSAYLNTDEKNVTVNVTFLGGGFGRKSKPDYVVEAAAISKAINAPVQVVWTREDDVKHGYYHTVAAQYMKGGLDKDGKVTGWLHRFALPSIGSTFSPGILHPAPFEASSATNVPFEIPNMQVETGEAPAHVRIGWMRSVINIPHGFAINVFADELANEAGVDPLEFRLNLIGSDRIEDTKNEYKYDTARLKHVLKLAAKNADWGKKLPEGHAMGLAVHYSFLSYVASVVEVSVINNKVKVHNIHSVIDCGLAVNKNTIIAQMEGAAIFGMSLAFYGKITAKDGAIEQTNFGDYQMLRMPQAPKIHVEIVENNEKPTGVGEPGVPVIAPAIVNAIFKATGDRYRSLPLKDHKLV